MNPTYSLVCALLLLSAGFVQAAPHYSVTDLGAVAKQKSCAVAINDDAQVVGYLFTGKVDVIGCLKSSAFLWQHGKMRLLGTLGGPSSSANSINNQGQVVGQADTRRLEDARRPVSNINLVIHHAFSWRHGKMRDLTPHAKDDTNAAAINNFGVITGDVNGYVVLWRRFHLKMVHRPGIAPIKGWVWDGTRPTAISQRGTIIGRWNSSGGEGGFLWRNGRFHDLGSGPDPFATLCAINSKGQIVGQKQDDAILWQHGHFLKIMANAHLGSEAHGISDRSEVVGYTFHYDDNNNRIPNYAFLWRNGKSYRLNNLIAVHSGWNLQDAYAINNKGQIVGMGVHHGRTRAFLLTPITP